MIILTTVCYELHVLNMSKTNSMCRLCEAAKQLMFAPMLNFLKSKEL